MRNIATCEPIDDLDRLFRQARAALTRILRDGDYLQTWGPVDLYSLTNATAILLDHYETACQRREIRES